MIADTAMLSTSPWHHDQLFRYPDLEVDVMSLNEPLESSLDVPRQHGVAPHSLKLDAMDGTSCGTSIASSDSSDEPCVDIESCHTDNSSLFAIMSDDIDTSPLDLLADTCFAESGLTGLGWSDSELDCTVGDLEVEVVSDTNSDILQRLPASSVNYPQLSRKRKCSEGLGDSHKTWNDMGVNEQLSVVEDLTDTISNQMGLREQLEVIRMINPQARVLPTDTEFVIDLEYLTDEKLHEVREYVLKHVPSPSTTETNNNDQSKTVSTQHKKRTKKQRRQEQKELRQRRRKEYRQTKKEKESGLFVREEVVALSNCEPSQVLDEDIDILT